MGWLRVNFQDNRYRADKSAEFCMRLLLAMGNKFRRGAPIKYSRYAIYAAKSKMATRRMKNPISAATKVLSI